MDENHEGVYDPVDEDTMQAVSKAMAQLMNKSEQPPPGWTIWGNFGDGFWRAAGRPQENWIEPAKTKEEAIRRAWEHIDLFGTNVPQEYTFR